ncbi:MAG TPA: fibronectin type III domain-containing protein [Planctomycetota bacterium]|nr:fibronectin type III domain-containing protein [Planctomycetota bacterium]
MNRSAIVAASAVLVAFALISASSAPAQAQQAAAYTNHLDSSSDVANWYLDGYPFPFAVDSSPIGGITGASLNWNNGVDINADYPYGYFQVQSMDITGMSNPVLSFWCRYEMNSDPQVDYREIYMYEQNNYDYIYKMFMGDGDGDGNIDLDCGSMNQWHQHTITLPATFVATGSFFMQFYTYSNLYYQDSGMDGWFIDDIQILVPDVTPPAAISDLAVSNAALDTLDVAWSSPTDDDVSGTTASFDLRYSTTAITGANFSSATAAAGEPAPDVAGTAHTMTITGLANGTMYFFAVKTTDIAGNVSTISNLPSLATLTPPPPPPPTGSTAAPQVQKVDNILPCSAGVTANSMGLLALAALVALAAAARMLRK